MSRTPTARGRGIRTPSQDLDPPRPSGRTARVRPAGRPPELPPSPRYRRQWADLMTRASGFDVLSCPRCGGRMKLIAAGQLRVTGGAGRLPAAPRRRTVTWW